MMFQTYKKDITANNIGCAQMRPEHWSQYTLNHLPARYFFPREMVEFLQCGHGDIVILNQSENALHRWIGNCRANHD